MFSHLFILIFNTSDAPGHVAFGQVVPLPLMFPPPVLTGHSVVRSKEFHFFDGTDKEKSMGLVATHYHVVDFHHLPFAGFYRRFQPDPGDP